MLKALVGSASLAIIAFVGFYFYQVYAAQEAAKAAERSRAIAAAEQVVAEACAVLPKELASEVSRPFPDKKRTAQLNDNIWGCIGIGYLEQRDLVFIAASDLSLPDGYKVLTDGLDCLGVITDWAASRAELPRTRKAAMELQVRRCVVDGLLSANAVKALAGDELNPLLGLAGLV